ncbi:MAG: 1-deoxy-D-xylulose-5-phosphate reductoisomerase [Porticoccaceae bacterium]|nr:MAG: 1-deoxy-D-xylulose-5-phosphate reductoisomerase [Porticoccaceae bacterium]
MQMLTVLGATGSIGISTLDVVSLHPDRFKVFALSCHSRVTELAEQCKTFKPRYAVVADASYAEKLEQLLEKNSPDTEVLSGVEGLCRVAIDPVVDIVMAAIVGAAGLVPTLEAAKAGKRVLLANKESLVMAGPLFMKAVQQGGATLLPIDSEHNAIFQCLPPEYSTVQNSGVRKILLTASGGPFRTVPLDSLSSVTPEQACAHPNWDMGRKISVDSATMMNKGLELIEACWLFGVSYDEVEVVIHPQSIIHSMVEYVDGSVLAQLGNPDMRTPIAHALAWPERIVSGVSSLDIIGTAQLDFEAPDLERFPCLALAMKAARMGGSAPAVLNAANEVAVEAFLSKKIAFTGIAEIVSEVLKKIEMTEPDSLEAVQLCDQQARQCAASLISLVK